MDDQFAVGFAEEIKTMYRLSNRLNTLPDQISFSNWAIRVIAARCEQTGESHTGRLAPFRYEVS